MFANFPWLSHRQRGRAPANQSNPANPARRLAYSRSAACMAIQDAVHPASVQRTVPGVHGIRAARRGSRQRSGQTADVQVGEGKVIPRSGTINGHDRAGHQGVMARFTSACTPLKPEEFGLLKERLQRGPGSLLASSRQSAKFLKGVDRRAGSARRWRSASLCPVADPTNPTSLHRISRAVALLQLAQQHVSSSTSATSSSAFFRIVGIDVGGPSERRADAAGPGSAHGRDPAKGGKPRRRLAQSSSSRPCSSKKQLELEAQNKAAGSRSRRKDRANATSSLSSLGLQQAAIVHAHELQKPERPGASRRWRPTRSRPPTRLVCSPVKQHQEMQLDAVKSGRTNWDGTYQAQIQGAGEHEKLQVKTAAGERAPPKRIAQVPRRASTAEDRARGIRRRIPFSSSGPYRASNRANTDQDMGATFRIEKHLLAPL